MVNENTLAVTLYVWMGVCRQPLFSYVCHEHKFLHQSKHILHICVCVEKSAKKSTFANEKQSGEDDVHELVAAYYLVLDIRPWRHLYKPEPQTFANVQHVFCWR